MPSIDKDFEALRDERDQLRAEVGGLERQVEELKGALSHLVADEPTGHSVSEDGKRCTVHQIIGVRGWPCPVFEAQRLVSEKHRSEQR